MIVPAAAPNRTTVAPAQPGPGDPHRAAAHRAAARRGHAGYRRQRDGRRGAGQADGRDRARARDRDRDGGRDGLLDRAGMPDPGAQMPLAQEDLFQRAALDGGQAGGRPQGREQQRGLAQVRPAPLVPARPVGLRRDLIQRGGERGRIGRPVGGLLGHPGGDKRPQRLGYRVDRHRLGHVLVHQRRGGIPAERRLPGQALEKRGRGRVHIPGRAGLPAAELLRRRVRQRAPPRRPVPGQGRDPEIGQLARPVPVHQHVIRLVIAVHHPARMRRGQAQQRAPQHHQRRLRRRRAVPRQDLPQRDPVHQLHHDRRPARRLHILMQPDHVRIIQRRQHRRLTPEHRREPLISQQIPAQVLDRHLPPRPVMPGQHHLTETARAERLHPRIPRNTPPGRTNLPLAVSGPGHPAFDQRVITHQ